MALSGRPNCAENVRFEANSGHPEDVAMSANDPKRTLAQPALGTFSKVESRDIIPQGA